MMSAPLRKIGAAMTLLVSLCATASADGVPKELIRYADFVLYNGQVLTADRDVDFTIAEAVALRDARILAVGTSDAMLRLAGPDTRSIDLAGRSVTPGFIYSDGDNSVPAGDLLKDSQWDGRPQPRVGGQSLEQILDTIRFLVREKGRDGEALFINLDDSWASLAMSAWDIGVLDELAPDTPLAVYLDSSYCLVNTKMIDRALAAGFPGTHFHLDRDDAGEYTGKAGAQLAGFIGREIRPWPSAQWFNDVAVPGGAQTLQKYARHGVTLATGHMSGATMTVLNRLFHDNDGDGLAIRVYPGLDFLRQNAEGEKYLKRIGNLVDFSLVDERGPMVTIVGASVGPHSGSPDAAASLLTIEPKSTVIPALSPNAYGYNRWTAEWFTGLGQDDLSAEQQRQTDFHNVLLARQHGWNVTGVHNMGSRAIRIAMQNILEAERQTDLYVPSLWRPQGFDHNIDWTPEVFTFYEEHPLLAEHIRFGVSLSSAIDQRNAAPLGINRVIEAQWGKDGLARMAPLKSLLDRGIPFHIEGTEPEADKEHPTWYIQRAITRIDTSGQPVAKDEALDRASALLALTRWAARFIGAEQELGSIEAGKLADLVVLDGDLMAIPVSEIETLKPVLTLVGGRIAWESPAL